MLGLSDILSCRFVGFLRFFGFSDFLGFSDFISVVSKSKVIKFTRVTKTDFPLEVAFKDGECLEELQEIKLLGLLVNKNLK